ncbi:MAG: mechanosensitive ion channel protein MscS [Opitutaceae bacterium]|nr:mechanosensitive ion channel protein MscS [Opitutaceae bacterium]|tara:strand:+ start:2057 stop:3364 length:1308 start_codon:yes stop_codon:yes gene_type:complete
MEEAAAPWHQFILDYINSPDFLWEGGAILVVLLVSFILAQVLKRTVYKRLGKLPSTWISQSLVPAFTALTMPAAYVLICAMVKGNIINRGIEDVLLTPASSLAVGWFLVVMVNRMTNEPFWQKLLGTIVIIITLLSISGLLDPTTRALDGINFPLGTLNITLLGIIKGLFMLLFLIWMSIRLSGAAESQMHKMPNITPSMEVLFAKVLKVILISLSILIGLQSVGIQLSSLTVLGGAIGLGLGFGLQKVISNLISGVILLLDKSIKPGDVISIENTYGWINKLSARYVSVITRDGRETLIPNENLITNYVENWSFSDTKVRLRAPIGVSYDTDVRKAIDLCIQAAKNCGRVLNNPEPKCPVKGFGDNSVDLELRFWIADPANGVTNIKSIVYLQIWDLFQEHGVEIPYPQRDIHIKNSPPPDLPKELLDSEDKGR